ncbi:hypothetical protein [Cumulibacter soli]|uniref:hypothetical protein n=1 Tax=Cumulibacter soli TaxID=2546344 RepID=UPI00106744CA|nr:hypothetical protein [Cumulibacter soli]
MSLLTNPPHVATVIPLSQPPDPDDGPVAGAAVSWACSSQPISVDLATSAGYDFTTTRRFAGVGYPGGSMARIEWDGRTWEQLGEPTRHRMSPTTSHDVVFAKAVGTKWQR